MRSFAHACLVAAAATAMISIAGARATELKLTIGTEGAYPPFNSVAAVSILGRLN